MSGSSVARFVHVGHDGMIVPLAAVEALHAAEAAGHRVTIDGAELFVEAGPGVEPLTEDQLVNLRRWRYHVRMLVTHEHTDIRPIVPCPIGTHQAGERGAS